MIEYRLRHRVFDVVRTTICLSDTEIVVHSQHEKPSDPLKHYSREQAEALIRIWREMEARSPEIWLVEEQELG